MISFFHNQTFSGALAWEAGALEGPVPLLGIGCVTEVRRVIDLIGGVSLLLKLLDESMQTTKRTPIFIQEQIIKMT